jgi:hypothetical protein
MKTDYYAFYPKAEFLVNGPEQEEEVLNAIKSLPFFNVFDISERATTDEIMNEMRKKARGVKE